MNDEARDKATRELERLSRMAPGSPEIGVSRTYIEWLLDLPWGKTTPDNLDLKRARPDSGRGSLRAGRSEAARH